MPICQQRHSSRTRRDGLVQERHECSSIELEDLEVDVVPGAVVSVVGHCKIALIDEVNEVTGGNLKLFIN